MVALLVLSHSLVDKPQFKPVKFLYDNNLPILGTTIYINRFSRDRDRFRNSLNKLKLKQAEKVGLLKLLNKQFK